MSSTLPKALDSTGGAAAGIGGHCAKSGGRRRPGRGVRRRRGGRGRGRGGGVSASSAVARAADARACRGAVAVTCEIAGGGSDPRARPRQPGAGARRSAARCDVADGPAVAAARCGVAGGRVVAASRCIAPRAPARRPERSGRGFLAAGRGAVAVAEPGAARAPTAAPGRGPVVGRGARQAAPGLGRRGGDTSEEASKVIVCLKLLGRDGQTTPLGIQSGLDRRRRHPTACRSALHDRVHLLR